MNIRESFLFTTPIAHRGLHGDNIPENSYTAFENAIKEGYAIEIDVRFTKDKKVVIFHDDDLTRLTGVDGKLIDRTYEEISELRLNGTDEPIPLFEDFLKFLNGRVPLMVEIKNVGKVEGLVEATHAILSNYGGEYAIQSFNPFYVKEYKKLAPKIFCGQLASRSENKKDYESTPALWKLKNLLLSRMTLNFYVKPDFVSYNINNLPYKRAEKYAKKKNKLLLCWVVRNESDYEKAKGIVNNIIFENIRP